MQNNKVTNRIWEIDFARGVCIILVIIGHIIFDLNYYFDFPLSLETPIIKIISYLVVSVFLILCAISSSFSKNNITRGLKLLVVAVLITIVTYFYSPNYFIKFGIIHLLAINIILYPILRRLPNYALITIGPALIVMGVFFSQINSDFSFLFPFGITNQSFSSLDYYPLLPWSGVFVLGIFLSRILYKERKSLFEWSIKNKTILWLGRHSLWVYIAHQSILLFMFKILS